MPDTNSKMAAAERPIYSVLGIIFIFLGATLYLSALSKYRPALEHINSTNSQENQRQNASER